MCVSLGVRVATVTTCTCSLYSHSLLRSLYRSATRQRSGWLFLFLLSARNSAGFRLCASAPLRLVSALLSVRLSALLIFQLCSSGSTLFLVSGSALPLVSSSFLLRSPLLLHSSLLCIRSSSATLNYYSTSAIIHNSDCGTHARHTFAGEIKINLVWKILQSSICGRGRGRSMNWPLEFFIGQAINSNNSNGGAPKKFLAFTLCSFKISGHGPPIMTGLL